MCGTDGKQRHGETPVILFLMGTKMSANAKTKAGDHSNSKSGRKPMTGKICRTASGLEISIATSLYFHVINRAAWVVSMWMSTSGWSLTGALGCLLPALGAGALGGSDHAEQIAEAHRGPQHR